MLFYVKVRIDTSKMLEMGAKLKSGELDKSCLKSTHCLQEDPAVGINIWEADTRESFDRVFAPHAEYYQEVIEISPVILPNEAMAKLMEMFYPSYGR